MTATLTKIRDDTEADDLFHGEAIPDEDEFPHGWRRITEIQPDGTEIYHDIPLSSEDFLNPRTGDQMPQGPEHAKEAIDMYNKLRKHYHGDPHIAVLFDTKIRWGIPGLKEPFPDISVIPDVRDRENISGSFDVLNEGTRPCLIIEVMSPGYKGDDTVKVGIYEQAGVQEYIILNPHAGKRNIPFELTGYELILGKYREIIPDPEGRILSRSTGVRFGLGPGGRDVVLADAATGEELLSNEEEYEARQIAEARAEQEAKARRIAEAEMRRMKAEIARLRDEV